MTERHWQHEHFYRQRRPQARISCGVFSSKIHGRCRFVFIIGEVAHAAHSMQLVPALAACGAADDVLPQPATVDESHYLPGVPCAVFSNFRGVKLAGCAAFFVEQFTLAGQRTRCWPPCALGFEDVMNGKSHQARLSVAMRALRSGWRWGADPRRGNAPALCSPRGAVYLLRGRFFVRWQDFRQEAA